MKVGSRDPRVNPRPGDYLCKGRQYYKVTMAGRQVHFELTSQSNRSPIYRIPMMCKMSLKQWREVMMEAENITESDALEWAKR